MAWKRLSSGNYTLGHNKPNFFTIYFSLGNKTQKTALEYPCSVVNGVNTMSKLYPPFTHLGT